MVIAVLPHSLQSILQDNVSMSNHFVSDGAVAYAAPMPKLWNETIDEHRRAVREATLDTAAALVVELGLGSVTMSRIAEATGIGRATLYKYFSSVEAILVAWHERQIAAHLDYLAEIRDRGGTAQERLVAVLEAYALISHNHHGTELAALLHRGEHVAKAERRLSQFIEGLIVETAKVGGIRGDVAPGELATYCLHALSAADSMRSEAAVRRLVGVILAGLRPPSPLRGNRTSDPKRASVRPGRG